MTPRFILLTFASCIVLFAAIWAATAPPTVIAPAPAAAPAAVMYADCDAVRAAGAAPLRADQPGYRAMLDPNMNGIACEAVGAPDAAIAPTSDDAAASPPPEPTTETPVQPPVDYSPPTPPITNAEPSQREM